MPTCHRIAQTTVAAGAALLVLSAAGLVTAPRTAAVPAGIGHRAADRAGSSTLAGEDPAQSSGTWVIPHRATSGAAAPVPPLGEVPEPPSGEVAVPPSGEVAVRPSVPPGTARVPPFTEAPTEAVQAVPEPSTEAPTVTVPVATTTPPATVPAAVVPEPSTVPAVSVPPPAEVPPPTVPATTAPQPSTVPPSTDTAPPSTDTAPPSTVPAAPAPAAVPAPAATRPPEPPAPLVAPPTRAAPTPREVVVAFALAQVGKPYVFGTSGPRTFDCSGLTLAAYRRVGITLPHLSGAQARMGRPVRWRAEPIRPGDLVFTRGGRPRKDLGHVGIAVSATEWVVAPAPGKRVYRGPIPLGGVQAVRRFLDA